MKKFDAIIIGAGQAGIPLAVKLAEAGKKVALIEKEFVGGTCINNGCTPTKTIISSGRMAYLANNSQKWGIKIENVSIDMPFIKNRKDDLIKKDRDGLEKWLLDTENVELIYGEAFFTGQKTISVKLNSGNIEELTAQYIFINTGCTPAIHSIDGIDDVPYLTSTTILELDIVPEHLLIIGASYVALEFGQLFRRLGSKVTILEFSNNFLSREDDDVADEMKTILEEENIEIYTKATVQKLEKDKNNIIATVIIDSVEQKINCSHLLVATGRKPQTERLNLKAANIQVNDKGYIVVDEKLQTNVTDIYALGDVNGGPAFTHISYNDFVIVYKNILAGTELSTTNRLVPYCMFTDPQLGRVGISEKEATKKGLNFQVAKLPMSRVARAVETGETHGFLKAIVDKDSKKILGATVIGVEGGDIMSVLQMAMQGGLTYDQLSYMVFAHPTFSESINNLFLSLEK